MNIQVASRVVKWLKTSLLTQSKNSKEILEKLTINEKLLSQPTKRQILAAVLPNRKKSAVKYSIEKFMLLIAVDLAVIVRTNLFHKFLFLFFPVWDISQNLLTFEELVCHIYFSFHKFFSTKAKLNFITSMIRIMMWTSQGFQSMFDHFPTFTRNLKIKSNFILRLLLPDLLPWLITRILWKYIIRLT